MIVCDPRNAPQYAWMMGWRILGLRYWLRLLRPPLMATGWNRVRQFPWCGWDVWWVSRPWKHGVL